MSVLHIHKNKALRLDLIKVCNRWLKIDLKPIKIGVKVPRGYVWRTPANFMRRKEMEIPVKNTLDQKQFELF